MNELNSFLEAFQGLLDIPDEDFNDDMMKEILESVDQNFAPELITQSVNQIIQNLEAQNLNKETAAASVEALKDILKSSIYQDKEYTGNKKILVEAIIGKVFNIFDSAIEKYHSYTIELPMIIDAASGAKVPTYAHETDAAADLYALEDMTLEPFSYGNKIRTGVKIQLPEGWMALIIPRSSIGAKTPLRLSNSIGLIDSGYRGELGILYDNISDKPWEIKAGDRMAQLLVMPSNRFLANVVDVLTDSDRGETGFGDSGK